MYIHILLTTTLLLYAQQSGASIAGNVKSLALLPELYHHRISSVELHVRHAADALLHKRDPLPQASNSTLDTPAPQSGNASFFNATEWEAQTSKACMTAMTALNGNASNPAGMAVCYNLPFLDNTTGVFEADLRLFQIANPTGVWVGMQIRSVGVGLSYLGATIASGNGSIQKRDMSADVIGAELKERQAITKPTMLQSFSFVGQINANLLASSNLDEPALQALLIPDVTLTALSKSSTPLNTSLSSTDASFLTGVFSQKSTGTTPSAASASAIVANSSAFVLPGTSLAFFPVGLVITSVWTGLLFLAVGLGTVGRVRFREHYRRRVKREIAMDVRTI
ncbi:MAG: hypothetical protein M1834_007475 [Cirrosporium novae-zelandiae]|nr:MAG: hypothetical protein M1834_007475 [Cirrosporium novae-zelandiae]